MSEWSEPFEATPAPQVRNVSHVPRNRRSHSLVFCVSFLSFSLVQSVMRMAKTCSYFYSLVVAMSVQTTCSLGLLWNLSFLSQCQLFKKEKRKN